MVVAMRRLRLKMLTWPSVSRSCSLNWVASRLRLAVMFLISSLV